MTTTQNSTTVTGTKAIELAERLGLPLSKYADPTEGEREGLTVAEAREIAREDPSLIYVVMPADLADGDTPLSEALNDAIALEEAVDELMEAVCSTNATINGEVSTSYAETILAIEADLSGAGEHAEAIEYSPARETFRNLISEHKEAWRLLWDAACSGEDAVDVLVTKTLPGAVQKAREALAGSNEPREWVLREEGYDYDTVTACSAEEALEQARANVDRSNYSAVDCSGTLWIEIHVRCEATGEEAWDTVECDPEEPDCEDGYEHDWCSPHEVVGGLRDNPGVWGKGGGVVIHEVCRHCGCLRTTDTWAQNPHTGEQGLRSVEYETGDHEVRDDWKGWASRLARRLGRDAADEFASELKDGELARLSADADDDYELERAAQRNRPKTVPAAFEQAYEDAFIARCRELAGA